MNFSIQWCLRLPQIIGESLKNSNLESIVSKLELVLIVGMGKVECHTANYCVMVLQLISTAPFENVSNTDAFKYETMTVLHSRGLVNVIIHFLKNPNVKQTIGTIHHPFR
jgi:hypothetical protein